MRLIVDVITGAVSELLDCYVVDTEQLTSEDLELIQSGSDSEISNIAIVNGRNLDSLLLSNEYGMVTAQNSVSYSPMHLRDEADAYLDSGLYEEDEVEHGMLMWVRDLASDEELNFLAGLCLQDDDAWKTYKTVFLSNLYYMRTQKDL